MASSHIKIGSNGINTIEGNDHLAIDSEKALQFHHFFDLIKGVLQDILSFRRCAHLNELIVDMKEQDVSTGDDMVGISQLNKKMGFELPVHLCLDVPSKPGYLYWVPHSLWRFYSVDDIFELLRLVCCAPRRKELYFHFLSDPSENEPYNFICSGLERVGVWRRYDSGSNHLLISSCLLTVACDITDDNHIGIHLAGAPV